MDWRRALELVGFDASREPSVEALALAAGIVAAAFLLGRFLSGRVHRLITARLAHRGDDGALARHSSEALGFAAAALVMLTAAQYFALRPLALLAFAAGLGVASARLARHLARAASAGPAIANILALAAGVAAAAGLLGGLEAFARGLDAVGLTVGARRISLLGVVQALLVAGVIFAVARLLDRLLRRQIERASGLDASQRLLAQKLASLGVIIAAVFFGIDALGIDLTALAVFSGAIGLAIGFGLQKTFGNLISGLILLMDRSIKPGDVIVVGDQFGRVSKIGVRAVSVLTRDGKEHLIPNEMLMTERVENWSYSDKNVRVRVPVGIAYDADIDLAQRLMLEAAVACPRALAEPPPTVWLKAFGESSVDHDILLWIDDPEAGVGNVQSDVLNRLFRLFCEHGVEIPFAQRDVRIRELPAIVTLPPAADPAAKK